MRRGFARRGERALRLRAQALLGRLLRRRKSPSLEVGDVRRILLVRTDKIGDAVVTTGLIDALRRRFPEAEVDVLLGRRNRAAAPLLPEVASVYVLERGSLQRLGMLAGLRRRRYDVAIDLLFADSITAALFTAGSGARLQLGFKDSTSVLYHIEVPWPEAAGHAVLKLLELARPLGIAPEPEAVRTRLLVPSAALAAAQALVAPEGDPGRPLLVNISASSPAKFWGVENYAALARRLAADRPVALVGAPQDTDMLARIAATSGVRHIPPRADLVEFAAVLSWGALLVSPDTAAVHIAAALGRPVVTLVENPLVATEWAPWGVPHRVVGGDGPIPAIPVQRVFDAVESLRRELGPDSVA